MSSRRRKLSNVVTTTESRLSPYQRKKAEMEVSDAPTFSFRSLFPDVIADIGGNLSDVKLVCGGKTFNCHRVILAQKSAFFQRMFASDESTENSNGQLKIEDISTDILEQVLKFIYCGYVDTDLLAIEDEAENEVLYAATKFNLSAFADLAVFAFREKITADNAARYLLLADRFNIAQLKIAAFDVLTVDEHRERAIKSADWQHVSARPDLMTELYVNEKRKIPVRPLTPYYPDDFPGAPRAKRRAAESASESDDFSPCSADRRSALAAILLELFANVAMLLELRKRPVAIFADIAKLLADFAVAYID